MKHFELFEKYILHIVHIHKVKKKNAEINVVVLLILKWTNLILVWTNTLYVKYLYFSF